MSKYTEWFPPEITPVYVGWYETYKIQEHFSLRRYWNGKWWSACHNQNIMALDQGLMKWRGLKEPA